ncbi:MAG: hypothetical protein AVDCRST_MAG76-1946 [uncultured Acidimicrobiales bacterium]|uniref:Uncharacterized protein n=1 Tax=uncultured Acidimicrobiales bacterium TaxID=310071 RepID=A0A6J4I6Y0_9ACTN|nr:MAG: hypothetical protein AVDCRST_MAG76-1946 [uncultured Acidimicrobiales bacterium]
MFRKVIVSAVLVVMLAPVGAALAVQYPPESTTTTEPGNGTTTTEPGNGTTTTEPRVTASTTDPDKKVVVAGKPKAPRPKATRPSGLLARTGGDLATVVRLAVVLMVLGFLFYLSGRYRRAAAGGDNPSL